MAHRGGLTRRVVLGAAIVGTALALIAPPVGSTDVSSYAVYGRMVAARHASPYTHVPADYPNDPWYPRMATFWHHTGSVYGPLFTGVSAAGMRWAGASALKGRLFFQLLAAIAFLVCVWLVDRATRGDPAALAFVAVNPMLIAIAVNGGHNDILVGAAVLAGVALVMQRRPRLVAAGVVLALGILVKVIGALALVALVLWLWRHRGRAVTATVAGAAAITTAAGFLLAGGPSAMRPVLHASQQQQLPSFWAYPRRWLTTGHGAASAQHTVGRLALLTVAIVAAAAIVIYLRERTPVLPVAGALFAFLVAGAYLMAWYPEWVLPLIALQWRRKLSLAIAAFAGVLTLAQTERPSQLNGLTYDVVHFLRDTALPVAELAIIALLVFYAVSALRSSSTASSASARISSSVRS
jgi:hypothetical protein